MFLNRLRLAVASAIVSISATVAAAATFDIENDFTIAANPSSPWSFGYYATLGDTSSFTLMPTADPTLFGHSGLEGWTVGNSHSMFQNTNPVTTIFFTISMDADEVALHPGVNGREAVLRFTAPSSDSYDILGAFSGVDFQGSFTTTDVSIYLNGLSIFSGDVLGFGDIEAFNITQALTAGDALDFAVGYGPDNNYFFDSTGLQLTISDQAAVVPLPPALPAMAAAVLAIGLLRRRRSG